MASSVEGLPPGAVVAGWTLLHREGALPVLRIRAAGTGVPASGGVSGEVSLSVTDAAGTRVSVFRGRLTALPVALDGEIATLEALGGPADPGAAVAQLLAPLAVGPFVNPLFLADPGAPSAAEILDARAAVVEADAVTGALSLEPLADGPAPTVTLGDDRIVLGSLSLAVVDTPLASITLRLEAAWMQQARRYVAIGTRLFGPDRSVRVLDGEALRRQLPPEGAGAGGWRLLASGLDSAAAVRSVTPRTLVTSGGTSPEVVNTITLQEYELEAQMVLLTDLDGTIVHSGVGPMLSAQLRQPRREQVTLTLRADLQPAWAPVQSLDLGTIRLAQPVEAILPFRLDQHYRRGDVIERAGVQYRVLRDFVVDGAGHRDQVALADLPGDRLVRASAGSAWQAAGDSAGFFDTAPGLAALAHGVQILRRRLVQAARCLELGLRIDTALAPALSPRDRVRVRSVHLPGGEAVGKVTQVLVQCDGTAGTCWSDITIALSVGGGGAGMGGASDPAAGILVTDGPVRIAVAADQSPPHEPVELRRLSDSAYAVLSAGIADGRAGAEAAILALGAEATSGRVAQIIGGHAPAVHLSLRDLSPSPPLERAVSVTLSPCPLPKEISL